MAEQKDLSVMSDAELESYLRHCNDKAVQYKIKQEALKVLANGLYGSMGSMYFRYYDIDMAEAITLSGQSTIDAAQRFFNEAADKMTKVSKDRIKVVDTDSVFLDVTDIVKLMLPHMQDKSDSAIVKMLDRLGSTKFQEVMDTGYEILQQKQNAYKPYLTMKREKICNLIVCAKKRYIAKVYVNEDVWYDTPDIAITGLETARSDVPKWCRDKLEEAFAMLFELNESALQKYISDLEVQFSKLSSGELAIPKGLTDLTKYELPDNKYRKGTTQHAKAAIVHNRLIDEKKLGGTYTKIRSGDKLKVLPLKIPNPTREEVVGFMDELPPEFGVDKYIDRKAIFIKTIKKPLERVLESIGWSVTKRYSIDDDFFE
jgi:DNA polymerase elongation subunit (family B)